MGGWPPWEALALVPGTDKEAEAARSPPTPGGSGPWGGTLAGLCHRTATGLLSSHCSLFRRAVLSGPCSAGTGSPSSAWALGGAVGEDPSLAAVHPHASGGHLARHPEAQEAVLAVGAWVRSSGASQALTPVPEDGGWGEAPLRQGSEKLEKLRQRAEQTG